MGVYGPRLACIALNQDEYVCSNGNSLELRSKTRGILRKSRVFEETGAVIYGILKDTIEDNCYLVYGEREVIFFKETSILESLARFSDWISSINILANGDIVVLTCHNILQYYSRRNRSLTLQKTVQLPSCGLLFCAKILGESIDELEVIVGNVFGDVISFKSDGNQFRKTEFKGHKGMIFGLAVFNNYIFSISDDRALSAWTNNNKASNSINSKPEVSEISGSLLDTKFGHSARPSAIVLGDCVDGKVQIFTGSVDETVCEWEFIDEKLNLKQYFALNGGPIRSLCYNDTNLYVGTSTGSAFLLKIHEKQFENIDNNIDFVVRSFANVESGRILIDDERRLLLQSNNQFTPILSNIPLRFNSLQKIPYENGIIAATEKDLHYYNVDTNIHQVKSLDFPICAMKFIGPLLFISSESDKCFIFSQNPKASEFVQISSVSLPSRHKISSGVVFGTNTTNSTNNSTDGTSTSTTGAADTTSTILIGTNKGALVLLSGHGNDFTVLKTLPKAHKSSAILDIYQDSEATLTLKSSSKSTPQITTIGKDGTVKIWEIINEELKLISTKITIEWPCKIVKMKNGKNYLIGFHADKFMIINLSNMLTECEVPCGGGHRIWSFNEEKCQFDFIGKGTVQTVQCNLSTVKNVQDSFHSSEATALSVFSNDIDECLFVIAGNDTKVCLGQYKNDSFKLLDSSDKHLSSVHDSAQIGNVVVTVGGRAEIVVWKVENSRLKHLSSTCLKGDARLVSVDVTSTSTNLNVLSLLVLSSEGIILNFHYKITENCLCEIVKFENPEIWSLTALKFLSLEKFVAINTVGEIILFELEEHLSKISQIAKLLVEQHPLTSSEVKRTENGDYVIIGSTSGHVSVVKIRGDNIGLQAKMLLHVSTVTDISVSFKNDDLLEIVSISLDRRLVQAYFNINTKSLEVVKIVAITTADPSRVMPVNGNINEVIDEKDGFENENRVSKEYLVVGYGVEVVIV